ncbi:phage tail protein [Paenibacillus sp. IB182496]|uniref:Phage tail protein n=1 Tax=Paenibacillus sabuli TaxID=2772509 RepID=A0A927GQ47_9BACL|nr:tail fiber protein [Paenibacillus sabuli]MBD2843901.1 phage tail protein [Paenibacillus sabuli]
MAEPFVGEIRTFAFGVIPKGWAPCNGQILQIAQNQALFVLLSNRYGGDGKTTFALPNLQGKAPLHFSGSIPVATSAGEASHTLTVHEMPQHTHQVSASTDNATLPVPTGNTWGTTPATRPIYEANANTTMSAGAFAPAGGSQPHNNMQPYSVLSFCIALVGIFPPKP